MNPLILENVTKHFGRKNVLKDITIRFEQGVHGLLGPNGAGKTTLLRCILGLLDYQGTITYDTTSTIGYLPQDFQIFQRLTVHEAMQYVAVLKNATQPDIDEALKMCRLEAEKNKSVKKLSGGMLRRLGIAQAILGNSDLLILDEPTVGLDPKQRVNIRNLIAEIGNNRTILLSTHIVEDIEHIADTVAILVDGTIAMQGDKHDLLAGIQGKIGLLTIPKGQVSNFPESVRILQTQVTDQGTLYRFLAETLPKDATDSPATLEDVYLLTTEQDHEE